MAHLNIDNILREIFDNSEINWKPTDKIPLVINEIEKLKSEMKCYLSDSGYNISEVMEESRDLCSESQNFIEEMENCHDEIEKQTMAEILKSIKNHEFIVKELDKVNFLINIVCDIANCGKFVKDFEDCRKVQSFGRAVEAITDLLDVINHPAEGYRHLTMYGHIRSTAEVIWENLVMDLYNQWDTLFTWKIETTSQINAITIDIKIDESPPTIDVLIALNISKHLSKKVSEFSSFLLNDILKPFIYKECTIFAETDEILKITVNNKSQNKPAYNVVLANIKLLFQYLSTKLNIEISNGKSIMKMIGNEIYVEFSEILIKDCLIDTVPNNMIDLQNYGTITSEIEKFQQFLTIVKFFPEHKFSILRYINNIDVLFAQKSSQYFLETARGIMLKDLSNAMSIGVEVIPDDQEPDEKLEDENNEEALKILHETIPKSLFYFPRCMISKTTQELLDLVYMIMEQAVQCSDVVSKKLYTSARLVFELYDAVVPYHHENYLLTIPQYVALFHNNCLYLAHNLQTLGDKWLNLMEGREMDYPISFLDYVPKLRELGYKHLTIHLQQQRKQILDNIRSSDLNCIAVKDTLGENAEQAIRQCLRQLQLLKNVWIGVFPINVFTRLMATLVNMFTGELVHRVCSAEDISADVATQLAEMYGLVIKKAPNLFQKPSDIEEHVGSWIKLQELILILGGSLKDIEKRWNNGNGPLAINFKNEELRTLIKALFQNTQFRANLLSKIK